MEYANPANATASAYRGVSQGATDIIQVTELDAIKGRLGEILNFVNHQGERVEMLAAKLTGGGSGQAKEAPNARPIACGTVNELDSLVGDIMRRLQATDEAVSRLRAAI